MLVRCGEKISEPWNPENGLKQKRSQMETFRCTGEQT